MPPAKPSAGNTQLPRGVVTLLFTDVVGSTRSWEQHGDRYATAIARHFDIVADAVRREGGTVFKTVGDQVCAAFPDARAGVSAALAAQAAIASARWEELPGPISVRMALHTGSPILREGDYFGPPVNRVARLCNAAHGAQVIVSDATRSAIGHLPGISVAPLGVHMLKDLLAPEAIFQVSREGLADSFPPPRTLDARPHNLPSQLTSFVDRVEAVAALASELSQPDVRLVTLFGPPGVGKTRLATQFAAEYAYRYEDGVWLVELAPIRDAGAVAGQMAAALGLTAQEGTPPADRLLAHLADRRALLVIDNFEHVLGATDLVSQILQATKGVQVLATSRSLLRIAGERCLEVSPLEAPESPATATRGSLLDCPATALFLDRASAVRSGWQPSEADAAQIAELCSGLDGLPLAIEFAAARMRSMSVGDIRARLSDRFRLLGAGREDLPEHQRTLRAALDWSYELLSPVEQAALAQLGVFHGGFTLPAAEAVCVGADIWEVVPALQDHSFLYARERDGAMRYYLLEAVREYALERLGDAENARREAHAHYFVALVEEKAAARDTEAEQGAFRELDAELDNIRAAMSWSSSNRQADLCARLTAGMEEYLRRRGYWTERLERLQTALALAQQELQNEPITAWLFFHLALALKDLRRTDESEAAAREGLSRSSRHGDVRLEARSLNLLGVLAGVRKDFAEAAHWHQASLDLSERIGDGFMQASALTGLGRLSAEAGDVASAARYYESSIAVWREIGSARGLATTLNGLGVITEEVGAREEAIRYYREALSLQLRLMNVPSVALILNNIAEALERDDRACEALPLYIASEALFRRSGSPNAEYVAAMRQRLEDSLPRDVVGRAQGAAADAEPLEVARAVGYPDEFGMAASNRDNTR